MQSYINCVETVVLIADCNVNSEIAATLKHNLIIFIKQLSIINSFGSYKIFYIFI
jgi:hypothetical protein